MCQISYKYSVKLSQEEVCLGYPRSYKWGLSDSCLNPIEIKIFQVSASDFHSV